MPGSCAVLGGLTPRPPFISNTGLGLYMLSVDDTTPMIFLIIEIPGPIPTNQRWQGNNETTKLNRPKELGRLVNQPSPAPMHGE